MNKGAVSSGAVMGIIVLAFIVYLWMPQVVHAITTTTTVTGWLIPDSAHFNNGIGALLFPLIGVGLFTSFPLILGYRGDLVVTMALVGLTIGSVMGMLSLTGSSNSVIPFALPVVAGADLLLWLWKGGKG